jgi:hypothetical protein
MRDVVEDIVYSSYDRLIEWDDGTDQIIQSYSYPHTLRQGWRSDVTPSNGAAPTYYESHRYKMPMASVYKYQTYKPFTKYVNGVKVKGRLAYKGTFHLPASWFGAGDGQPMSVNFPNRVENRAIANLYAKVRGTEFDAAQFFGELPETGRLLANATLRALPVYRAIRNGNYRLALKNAGASSLVKGTADSYLAFKFGLQPLLQDIYSMAQAVKPPPSKNGIFKVKAFSQENHVSTLFLGAYHDNGSSVNHGCEASATYGVSNATLAALNVYGLLNPAALAWELLPLSFVVDWFLPIGAFLSSLTAGVGLDFKHGYITRFSRGSVNVKFTGVLPSSYGGDDPTFSASVEGSQRRILYSFPTPSLAIPSVPNAGKALTALALATQRS